MNGLIGNAQSAKFIFIACDDENLVPTKSEMNNYFPNHQMNVYKSWGYFSRSFTDIENYMKIRHTGINAHQLYQPSTFRVITHAIRLNPDLNRNAFFDLKYAGIHVESLHLSHESLSKLSSLLNDIGHMNSLIDEVLNCNKLLSQTKAVAENLMLNDQKILFPNQHSMDDLFDCYGDVAKNELMDRLNKWHESVIWN